MRYPETAALIKQARLKKGLSQEKAARRIGCSRLQWINWEQGLHRPEKYAASLVEVIGVDADKLSAADGGDLDQEALMAPLARAVRDIVRAEVRAATLQRVSA
jgi:transcriptional regulator with XRE-family HTH domain